MGSRPRRQPRVNWIISHLQILSPFGAYLGLFTILLLCGFGLPVPEDITLIAAGYLSWLAKYGPYENLRGFNKHMAFAVCLLAVLGGDTIAFFFGRRYGRRVLASKLARRYFTPRRQLRTRAYFRKFGSKVVLVGRFTPGLRFTIFFTAGTLHVRAATFFLYDFVAAACSVPVLVYVAYAFGEQINNVIKYARRAEHGILIVIVIVTAIVVVKLMRRRKRIARLAAAAE
jgi:membrane protein DedA with SNARE-associated domain